MNGTKHILILLSLMLCFGNVSGQVMATEEEFQELMDYIQEPATNLACYIEEDTRINDLIFNYEFDYALFKIKSPLKTFRGTVHTFKVITYEYTQLDSSSYTKDLVVLKDVDEPNFPFKGINRKSLELKASIEKPFFSTISVCEIVSESKMKQLEKELVDEYNKGNQI
tara:strand:+ start:6791 stop:7294 length:504 start_codon:yes stop_codon:yes gene_type:complete